MDRHAFWHSERLRRRKRQELIAFVAAVAAVNISAMLAVFELRYGTFGGHAWSRRVSELVLVLIAVLDLAVVLSPERVGSAVVKGLQKLTGALTGFLVAILLVLLFVVTLPLAATVGRRGFLSRHPVSAPWIIDVDWRVSTWHRKQVDFVAMNRAGRSTTARALGLFIRQRNFFLLTVAVILLVLAAITVFAQTSPIAPFLYPLI
jgi:hypothetical protein